MTARFLVSTLRNCVLCSLLFSHMANADALGLFFGVSGWTADSSGDLTSGPEPVDVENDLGFDSETLTQGYLAFEHFIPLIPNLRLQYTELSFEGEENLNKRFDGIDFNGSVKTDLSASQTDLMAYWRLLDNVINFDIGLQVSMIEGDLAVKQSGSAGNASATSFDEFIPMAYVSAGVDLPFTGLSLTGGFSGGGQFDGSQLTDLRASLIYELEFIGAEIGWRRLAVELDDVGGVTTDLSISGPYIGVSLHF